VSVSRGRGKHQVSRNTTVQKLHDLNLSIQQNAFFQGRALNDLASELDAQYEPLPIGKVHAAAGILPYRKKEGKLVELLLGEFPSEDGTIRLNLLGGKASGLESPVETAVREFSQEILELVTREQLTDYFSGRLDLSKYIPEGKYTVFPLEASELKLGDEVVTSHEAKRAEYDDKVLEGKGPAGDAALKLVWWPYRTVTKVEDPKEIPLNPILRHVLTNKAVSNFLAGLM